MVVLVVLFSLRTLATFYTDYLWFGSVHFGQVWRTIFEVKVGLFFGFAAIFFVVLWVNLAVVDRLAPSQLMLGPEDELVRRYQQHVAPRAVLVRTLVSVVIGLIAASGVIGQWKNYLMFMNGVPFSSTDPQFHKNVAFFVFELPFLSFLVSWAFVSLVVIAIFTVIAHYLNGGIRIQSGSPNVAPQVKVHLSVLLACMALVKAFGYVLARYNLDLSQNGYVQGATYTDVHARLPAYTLLIWISVLAAIIFLVNIRRRGWALPVLGVGLWAFVAVVIGAIYPAIVQAIKVNPAQNSLERPYIARNISATRAALGLNKVSVQGFNAGQSLTPSQVLANEATLNNVQLWDPTQTSQTYTKLQAIRSYYSFNTLAVDRYKIAGTIDPTVIGVRQVNDSDLPQSGWVNTHLQYTHGYAGFLAPSNAANEGNPSFAVSNVPAQSAPGAPAIKQPRVYFGIANPNGGDANYVLADTRQPEIDYQVSDASNPVTSTYHGTGGVQLTNDFKKLAFAIRFGDFNLLVSNLVTSHSRLMFVRDVTQMAQKAAPFLSFDSDPYPVVVDGQIYWVLDAYTTTDNYPYAQNVDTSSLAANSGLNQNFNYVRNSVKVVVNAYSGAMKFYDVTALTHTEDPILQMWEKVFPGLFTPVSDVSPKALVSHFRYPEDLLTVQAATYGRYHITQPLAFYNATNAWNVSESAGSGPPNQALPTTLTTNAQGQVVNTGQVVRMSPEYEVFQVPGQSSQSYNLVDAFSPVSQGDQIQTMSGFIVAGSDPGNYGKLTVFQTPAIEGPALIDADIAATQKISSQISLLNQNGSSVLLGTLQFVPVGNAILYFRPFYVESSRNPFPQLDYYIVVYSGQQGQSQVAFETTLTGALQDLFQVSVPNQSSSSSSSGSSSSSSSGSSSTVSQHIQSLIAQAATDFQQSQTDLKAGNFAAYGTDQQNLQNVLTQLQQATQAAKTTSPTTTRPKATSATSTTDASTSTTSGGVALGNRSRHGSTS
ncbi:MAG TPA: UPF0182 family protein [Acidimicrobiales bacterium]|nr:UPF0182 family protein [Acidimicrobiales bacterium]